MFQAKSEKIDDLNDQLKKQIIAMKEEQEKIEEPEIYIQQQKQTYSAYIANIDMEKEELPTKYDQLANKYEQVRTTQIVADTKLQFDKASTENRLDDLKQEMATLKYKLNMGEQKVQFKLSRHKEKMRQMIIDLLDKGWKTWSIQAAKLQLLRDDHENKKKQGQAFFKMNEASITTIRDELANDIYELITHHKEEINKLLEEFDDKQITIAIELDAYEKERHQQEGELEENGNAEPTKEEYGQTIPISGSHQEDEAEQQGAESMLRTEQEQQTENQQPSTDVEDHEDEEPTLFNMLNEAAYDMEEDDLTDDKQIADNAKEDDQD